MKDRIFSIQNFRQAHIYTTQVEYVKPFTFLATLLFWPPKELYSTPKIHQTGTSLPDLFLENSHQVGDKRLKIGILPEHYSLKIR